MLKKGFPYLLFVGMIKLLVYPLFFNREVYDLQQEMIIGKDKQPQLAARQQPQLAARHVAALQPHGGQPEEMGQVVLENSVRSTSKAPSARTFSVNSLDEALGLMKTLDITQFDEINMMYPSFTHKEPNFINGDDRYIFMTRGLNKRSLSPINEDQLRGTVWVIRNGSYREPYDCGYGSTKQHYKVSRKASKHYKILCPLIIPMAFVMMHFWDGTMPKIAQAYPLLLRRDVTLLLDTPKEGEVLSMLERLNISDRVVWHTPGDTDTVYSADYIISTCITPPLHPLLWTRMRRMIGVSDQFSVTREQTKVVLLCRYETTGPTGKNILNLREVIEFLEERYPDQVHVYTGSQSLASDIDLFSKARIIIGVHGPQLFNLNFAARETTIVEYFPYGEGDALGLPQPVFWVMSDLLGQTYWRVSSPSVNYRLDVELDLDKLATVLYEVDKKYQIS